LAIPFNDFAHNLLLQEEVLFEFACVLASFHACDFVSSNNDQTNVRLRFEGFGNILPELLASRSLPATRRTLEFQRPWCRFLPTMMFPETDHEGAIRRPRRDRPLNVPEACSVLCEGI